MKDSRPERWWVRRDRKRAERSGLDPRRFFFHDYPCVLAQNVREYRRLSGALVIAIRGLGEWTLNLGDVDAPVVEGRTEAPDAVLCFVPTAFGNFLRGDLDVKSAMAIGDLTVRGSLPLVVKLAELLRPKTSIIQTRAALFARSG